MKSDTVIAFLMGAVVALGSAVTVLVASHQPQKAHASEDGRGDLFGLVGTGFQGQSRDVLFVLDATQKRMAVYEYKSPKISLTQVRNITYDLKFEEWPGRPNQTPSVKEQRDAALKEEKKP